MKGKIKIFINKTVENEILCLGSLIAALLYNIWLIFIKDPFNVTITHIIRDDVYVNYDLLLVWAALTGIAVFLNINRLTKRTNTPRFLARIAKTFAIAGLIFLTLSSVFVKQEMDFLHTAGAMAFAGFMIVAIVIIALGVFFRSLRYAVLLSLHFFCVFVLAQFILELRQFAIWETLPILEALVLLLICNYCDFFRLKVKEKDKDKDKDKEKLKINEEIILFNDKNW
ncbi:MAG: hypothetical protein LBT30_06135 [Clostridiales bacterium]|jgi:hypothetical protein|nr:hypothetical protein [Clostridiales bacterium]